MFEVRICLFLLYVTLSFLKYLWSIFHTSRFIKSTYIWYGFLFTWFRVVNRHYYQIYKYIYFATYAVPVPEYSGRVTVPVLWDKHKQTIVNNESSEIIRMLNSEFNEFCETQEQKSLDLYPEGLRQGIDELNSWIYPWVETCLNFGPKCPERIILSLWSCIYNRSSSFKDHLLKQYGFYRQH